MERNNNRLNSSILTSPMCLTSPMQEAAAPFHHVILLHFPPPPPGCLYGYTYGQQTFILPAAAAPVLRPVSPLIWSAPLQQTPQVSAPASPAGTLSTLTPSPLCYPGSAYATVVSPDPQPLRAITASISSAITAAASTASNETFVGTPVGEATLPSSPVTTFKPFGNCGVSSCKSPAGFVTTPPALQTAELSAENSFASITHDNRLETDRITADRPSFWCTKERGFPRPEFPAINGTHKHVQQQHSSSSSCNEVVVLTPGKPDETIEQHKRLSKFPSCRDKKFVRTSSKVSSISPTQKRESSATASPKIKYQYWRKREGPPSVSGTSETVINTQMIRRFSFGCMGKISQP